MTSEQWFLFVIVSYGAGIFVFSSFYYLQWIEYEIVVLPSLPFSLQKQDISFLKLHINSDFRECLEVKGFGILKLWRIHLDVNIFVFTDASILSTQKDALKFPIKTWVKIITEVMIWSDRVFHINLESTTLNEALPGFNDEFFWIEPGLFGKQISHPCNYYKCENPEFI